MPITPKTPLVASPQVAGGADADEEIYKKVSSRNKLKYRKVKLRVLVEWFVSFCIIEINFIVKLDCDKRIQEAIFHQYILLTLSGPPIMESAQMLDKTNSNTSRVDSNRLRRVKGWKERSKLGDSFYDGEDEQTDKEITNEEEAIAAAYHIFRNVAQHGNRLRTCPSRLLIIQEEVDLVFPMIDVAETGHIDRKALTDWVVKFSNLIRERSTTTPNSVVTTKAISNYYRSPDMGDSVEFLIDFRGAGKIGALKDRIKNYPGEEFPTLASNHSVVVKEMRM
ncbi:hypothetical protein Leryth_020787 [Lithospermum erythrorhizon]|nr:hypothetical protein Leryth_020787 [Lithospermum erythrorhizon]